VRNMFGYQRMNAYKNIFVYILVNTFLKWPVFPSLTKTLQIKLTSEIGFHIKYVSVIIVFIQLHVYNTGTDPGFQVRGGVLKKIAPSGGRRENFGVFRVKNHDFTPKNHIFPILGGAPPPPWIRPCNTYLLLFDLERSNDFYKGALDWQ
jgi:hypothetical protein